MEDAHQGVRRGRRIGERAKDVEDGAHAHFTPHWRDVLHRAVVVGREHEADAALLDAGGDLFWRQIDVGTQRFEHVGAARARRHAAPAVLGHLGAGRSSDEDRCGGNIEAMRGIAAGADDIDEVLVVRHLDRRRQLAHDTGGGGDLADGFLLDAQSGDDGGNHHRRDFAAHDLAHQRDHFVVEDFAMLDDALEGGLRGHCLCSSRKLLSRS
ncbi:hypothetical protein SDC9_168588 [bioreactor metagenome]|uniref:Uncharacterized protein n=1 Tax=bioreactor metagenome TaxID=1076179 RepID=A0A645G5X5_9ZZZZ